MISLIDISHAVSSILSKRFSGYTIYDEDIKDSAAIPCFYIEVLPTSAKMENRAEILKVLTINIQYASTGLTNTENLNMIDSLNQLFTLKLRVNDRYLNIIEQKYKIIDDILHYSFHIEFIDDITNELTEKQDQISAQNIIIS